jgi:translation initiation factor IF-2
MAHNRAPIIVILGHVDHGKTSLLDAIRKTDIAASEAGGITQSVRSFQIQTPYPMTFIDTPGHAAFSAMRSRGGKIADIALLIVSGSDGVMPQTKESITTIKKLNIPYIVVLTKKDLAEFSADKAKTQLSESEVFVEDFGGDIPVVAVSAKTGEGLTELLEMINLVYEMNPVVSDDTSSVEGIVLESALDQRRGPIAVVVLKKGTLQEGQAMFVGHKNIGKVKAITATSGERIKQASAPAPVEILGLSEVPAVGSMLSNKAYTEEIVKPAVMGVKADGFKLILKADVIGSLEAIQASLDPDVQVILAATGDISDSDVLMADTSQSLVVGFNVKVSGSVAKLAETEKVKIKTYKIIYELLDEVHTLAHPEVLEKIIGRAQIAMEFKINESRVAGSRVLEGELKKGDTLRILRNEVSLGETRFKSLKMGKTEVESVKAGQEFGAIFGPHIDFKTGDIIISYQIIKNATS